LGRGGFQIFISVSACAAIEISIAAVNAIIHFISKIILSWSHMYKNHYVYETSKLAQIVLEKSLSTPEEFIYFSGLSKENIDQA